MDTPNSTRSDYAMKILPAYTGLSTIEEVLNTPRALRLLWIEILLNEHLPLTPWENHPAVQQAHDKACRWYTTYRTLVDSMVPRTPLPHNANPIDYREYRVFAEALQFAAAHA
ncbi:MAG: hypothetical protein MRJ96_09270 [Nitrospirales bacterium]|nr:hypothetical protein [Nitrospira sp.]MDR4501623.1 hypothetical protein [Nitrospirales bacterium]